MPFTAIAPLETPFTDDAAAVHTPKPVNILIVDDLPQKRLVYDTILRELGQNIVLAPSGEEALKLVLQSDFAVILLDVNMPGMDGFETASLIHQRKKSAGTPIIFLTAFTDDIHAAQGYASGAVDYLSTPVIPEILKAKVRVFVELAQMRQRTAHQAEEEARRAAAEDNARRLNFLVRVSEVLSRQQNVGDILRETAHVAIPYLADASLICLFDEKGEVMGMEWSSADGHLSAAPPSLKDMPWLEEAIDNALKAGQVKLLKDLPAHVANRKSLPAALRALKSGLVLPFVIQEKLRGVLFLARESCNEFFMATKISLAGELVSRATTSLENAFLIKQIRDADRKKDEFLAVLAHELRNPLAPVSNALQIISMDIQSGTLVPRTDELVKIMQRQVVHMSRLVDDLLDVSRITQGKIELVKEAVEINTIIKSAIESSQPLISDMKHRLTVRMPDERIYLTGDVTRLSQVLSNLLSNAAKYTEPGGAISLQVSREKGCVSIEICDSGIGISAPMLEKIFELFTQVDSSVERSHGGLGIGLKLAKELCEMHGGTISAASPGIGKGSTFTVRLPLDGERRALSA